MFKSSIFNLAVVISFLINCPLFSHPTPDLIRFGSFKPVQLEHQSLPIEVKGDGSQLEVDHDWVIESEEAGGVVPNFEGGIRFGSLGPFEDTGEGINYSLAQSHKRRGQMQQAVWVYEQVLKNGEKDPLDGELIEGVHQAGRVSSGQLYDLLSRRVNENPDRNSLRVFEGYVSQDPVRERLEFLGSLYDRNGNKEKSTLYKRASSKGLGRAWYEHAEKIDGAQRKVQGYRKALEYAENGEQRVRAHTGLISTLFENQEHRKVIQFAPDALEAGADVYGMYYEACKKTTRYHDFLKGFIALLDGKSRSTASAQRKFDQVKKYVEDCGQRCLEDKGGKQVYHFYRLDNFDQTVVEVYKGLVDGNGQLMEAMLKRLITGSEDFTADPALAVEAYGAFLTMHPKQGGPLECFMDLTPYFKKHPEQYKQFVNELEKRKLVPGGEETFYVAMALQSTIVGDVEVATPLIGKALDYSPDNGMLWHRYAKLDRSNEFKSVLHMLDEVQSPIGYYIMGCELMRADRSQEAKTLFKKCRESGIPEMPTLIEATFCVDKSLGGRPPADPNRRSQLLKKLEEMAASKSEHAVSASAALAAAYTREYEERKCTDIDRKVRCSKWIFRATSYFKEVERASALIGCSVKRETKDIPAAERYVFLRDLRGDEGEIWQQRAQNMIAAINEKKGKGVDLTHVEKQQLTLSQLTEPIQEAVLSKLERELQEERAHDHAFAARLIQNAWRKKTEAQQEPIIEKDEWSAPPVMRSWADIMEEEEGW